MNEPSDMERSRLLLGWLAARRAVDHCLSDLLAAGPAGERRVRESLDLVDDLETRARAAFDRYRTAAATIAGRVDAGRVDAGRVDAGLVNNGGIDDRGIAPIRLEPGPVEQRGGTEHDAVEHRSPVSSRNNEARPAENRTGEPRSAERWNPSGERPRLGVVRAPDADLARTSANTKGNQRHR